jgi:putative transposase
VRVYQDNLGHWYASFVVSRPTRAAAEVSGAIGIDWGVSTVATTTDPAYDLPYEGYRRRCAADLAKAQRRMGRRRRPRGQAPSNGYRRAKREAAKIQKKAARQNTHAARVWARRVVDHHQLIAVEDFRPRFLAKSTMARKAADSAIGTAKRELLERGVQAGRTMVLVPPACTTMTCSGCGEKQARLGLAERTFHCPGCGYTAGRDRNAARVILATAERGRVGADDIRHPSLPSRAQAACDLSHKSQRQPRGIVKTGVSQTACPW